MATFPDIKASYGTTKKSAPFTRTIRFADGYEHRINFGIAAHQNPKVFSFSFDNLTEADSDTIETFLDARKLDNESFTYTPDGESSSMQFVCDSWNKTINYVGRATITTQFRQVFEPSS